MSLCVCIFQFSKVKPFIIRGPYDQTVVEGSSVTFQCRVGGEPVPDILCENNFYIIFFSFICVGSQPFILSVLGRRTAAAGNMPLGI